MKNKLKFISAAIILLSVAVSAFSACKSGNTETLTTSQTEESTKIHATDYTYNTIAAIVEETETKYIHNVPPIPTEKEEKKTERQTENVSSLKTELSSKTASSNGKIDEISNGLNIITKTSPVSKGNAATIIIQGKPDAKYSIEFYKSEKEKASYNGLNNTTADSSGFASWTFMVENDCEIGERKIIIKELNSDKYIQTSINVQ